MNRTRHTTLGALAAWLLLCGCMLFPRNNTPEPIPFDDEGCDDNHASFWAPDPQGVEIIANDGPADAACNRLFFHSGGGAQGGDIFHIEPVLRFTGDHDLDNLAITWEFRDPDTDDLLGSQGFEVYPGELVSVDGGMEHRAQVFIGPDERGKNLKLVALSSLPVGDGTSATIAVRAEAAVYLVEQ